MIYIVIPVFNRKHFTQACLDSLRKQTYKDFKVVVVDDGSSDGTGEMLAHDYPEVITIKGDGNLWWTAATNLGIKKAQEDKADYVLTLNNDTLAPENYLEKMYFWAQQKPNALLGSLGIDSDTGKAVYGGENLDWRTNKYYHLLNTLKPEQQVGLHAVTHYPGRGLLIPIHVFDTVGLFDEKVFPHYFADYDFTYAAYAKGFELYCNYDAPLMTYPEASGDHANRRKKTLKNYYNHLFGMRGGANLKDYTNFVMRHCPNKYKPFVLADGYFRRIFGYIIK